MAKNKNEKKDEKAILVEDLETLKDVENETVEVKDEAETKDNDKVLVGTVNCDKLRVRKEPSTDAEILKYLKKGDEVVIESEDDKDFYKIAAGFVMKEFISLKI